MGIRRVNFPIMKKDVGLRIRVEKELREAFLNACRKDGNSAAQVLRNYMRRYADYDDTERQGELFEAQPAKHPDGDDSPG